MLGCNFVEGFGFRCVGRDWGGAGRLGERDGGLGLDLGAALFAVSWPGGMSHCCSAPSIGIQL